MTHEDIYNSLINKIKLYHPTKNPYQIEKAYKLALEAHGEQLRKSGEPYIIHPLSVAVILSELGLDMESLVAGILHDIIEDTDYTYNDISNIFGEEVALLVEGVTKLDKIEYKNEEVDFSDQKLTEINEKRVRNSKIKYIEEKEQEYEDKKLKQKISKTEELQAENYRKMFLAMAKDIRVIIIKIADRLHNMRTLNYMKPEKQKQKAQETLDIYAPLAHRLGISTIRYELEDLSFRYLDTEAYYQLAKKISRKQSERQSLINKMEVNIISEMKKFNIDCSVEGRPKHFFSIYKKMIKKAKTLDQMYDLFAMRIIVNSVMECYEVLGIIHDMYRPIQGRFKDYISVAKTNMYQSLHTTVIGIEGEPFEIQIRTWDMHRVAEYGIAAHWKYKENSQGVVNPESEEAKLNWLRQILEWQRDMSDNQQYLSELKTELNIFKGSIYCFTPKGEVISLPINSTPIDFAYAIHSAVGNTMVGAKVNSNIVPFDYELKTGDRVEISTSRNSKGPKVEWLKIVNTSQARNKIKNWLKEQNKEENTIKGKELLELAANKKNVSIQRLLTEDRKKAILKRYNYIEWDAFLASIGHGSIKEAQVINRLIEEQKLSEIKKQELENTNISEANIDLNSIIPQKLNRSRSSKNKKSGVIVQGADDLLTRFSKCCTPLPGDEIIGFITKGRGVSIHRTDCTNIISVSLEDRNRLIEAHWEAEIDYVKGFKYTAELSIKCDDRAGIIMDISSVFLEFRISIKSLNARCNKNTAIFNLIIEVSSRQQLDRVCNRILSLKGVHDIERMTR